MTATHETDSVMCDGVWDAKSKHQSNEHDKPENTKGHPRIYLTFKKGEDIVTCPYCSHVFKKPIIKK